MASDLIQIVNMSVLLVFPLDLKKRHDQATLKKTLSRQITQTVLGLYQTSCF